MSNSRQGLPGSKLNSSAMLTLCVLPDSASKQERYFLSPAEETVVGRAPECGIALDPSRYPTVSRYHAKIRLLANTREPGWEICNLSTTNGTYINGKQISECHVLQPGDIVTFSWKGPEFLFEYQALAATVFVESEAAQLQEQELLAAKSKKQQDEAETRLPVVASAPVEVPASSTTQESTLR